MNDYGVYQSEGYYNNLSFGAWWYILEDWVKRKRIAQGKEANKVAYFMAKKKSLQPKTPPSFWIRNAFKKQEFDKDIADKAINMGIASSGVAAAFSKEIDIIFKDFVGK